MVESDLVPHISDFIRIPNLSRNYDQNHMTNGLHQKACNFALDWVKKQDIKGLTLEMIEHPDRTPILFGEVAASEGVDTTFLMYGHLDKQPHLNDAWSEGLYPTEPVRKGDLLYGRGGADDGYAIFASLGMVKLLQQFGAKHPRFVLFFETDEESGSCDIMKYMNDLKDKIGDVNLIICLDAGGYDYENFFVTSTLRGCIVGDLTVKILKQATHSGQGSGVVADSYRIMSMLLNRVEDPKTGMIHKDLFDKVPGKVYLDSEKIIDLIGDSLFDEYEFLEGCKPSNPDPFEAYMARNLYPQLAYVGMDGVPDPGNAGNLIRTHTTMRLSCRLPPTADVPRSQAILSELLLKNPPYGAQVTMDWKMGGEGFFAPLYPANIEKILHECTQEAFDKDQAYFSHMGGSIPFMGKLAKFFPQSFFMVTGILGPGSNAHAGDENLHVGYLKKVMHALTRFCERTAQQDWGTECFEEKRKRHQSGK